jgi:hypothetical protein
MNHINNVSTAGVKWRQFDDAEYLTWKRSLQATLGSLAISMHLNYFYWFKRTKSYSVLRLFNGVQSIVEIASGALIITKIRAATANDTNETWMAAVTQVFNSGFNLFFTYYLSSTEDVYSAVAEQVHPACYEFAEPINVPEGGIPAVQPVENGNTQNGETIPLL